MSSPHQQVHISAVRWTAKGNLIVISGHNVTLNQLQLCHCLSMWLNCLPGWCSGIASIVVIWLITCMFPILIPLCPVFAHFICLALGQRLYCPHIPLSDAYEGLSLLSRLIDAPVYS